MGREVRRKMLSLLILIHAIGNINESGVTEEDSKRERDYNPAVTKADYGSLSKVNTMSTSIWSSVHHPSGSK